MGPTTAVPPPSSDVKDDGDESIYVDPSSIEKTSDHQEAEKNPVSNLNVQGFMMSLCNQDNINFEEVRVVTPGVVSVMGTNRSPNGQPPAVEGSNDTSVAPIVAHLAPDEADVEALLQDRLATMVMPVVEKVEERMRQQQQQLNQTGMSPVRDDNIMVAEEVKNVSRPQDGSKKGRNWMIGFILLLAVGAGVLFWLLQQDNDTKQSQPASTQDPTAAPVDAPSQSPSFGPVPLETLMQELRSWIAPTEADELPFMDPSSPQSQALAWLQDDPITQTPGRSTRTVLERYALAVLYYTTAGPSWRVDFLSRDDACTWHSGSVDVTGKSPQLLVGVNIYGMYCALDGESIDVLVLMDNHLTGPLPWEFFLLSNLGYVNMNMNSLSGTFPSQISNLTNLEVFVVGDNRFTGTLPTSVGQLSKLSYFHTYNNLLTGMIPSELGQMTSLSSVYFDNNSFVGSVEESLCGRQWSNLGFDCAEVDCSCCTLCCYDNQTQCG
jgi:hypothetical protein